MIKYLLQLLYPNTCICCYEHLVNTENFVCTLCLLEVPATNFHLMPHNDLEKLFWGLTKIERAIAFLFYKKGGKTSKILHALKYHETPEIAEFLGRYYGTFLKDFILENKIDAVVAIPLHKNKLHNRGFNQSEKLATGLANTLCIENLSFFITRNKFTETQTRKSRTERNDNVEKVFKVNNIKIFENKHVLIVDDVITTGATMNSCANEILQISNCKVSVAALAFA